MGDTTRGPLIEEFPACVHLRQGGGFWDGRDERGRRTGGYLRCYHCHVEVKGKNPFGLLPEDCHACRQQPTQGTLDSLSAEMVEAALRDYAEVFEKWQKGVRVERGEWARVAGAIGIEVRARADQLQAEGVFSAAERDEYLTGAAIVRGLLFGWCLHEAVSKSTRGGDANVTSPMETQSEPTKEAVDAQPEPAAEPTEEKAAEPQAHAQQEACEKKCSDKAAESAAGTPA